MPKSHASAIRRPDDLPYTVGSEVLAAVKAVEAAGGRCTHDSGHARSPTAKGSYTSPTFIYTFDHLGGAQIALPMNRQKLSVYARAAPHLSPDFERTLAGLAYVDRIYDATGTHPHSALRSDDSARYLNPARHRLLLLTVQPGQFSALLDCYLGRC